MQMGFQKEKRANWNSFEDYDEVFAPVVRSAITRVLLYIAGDRKLHLEQFDVKSAFLNVFLK